MRHTRPDVAEGLCYGRTDLGLAAGSMADCDGVITRLSCPTMVVSSPLERCRVLASRISGAFGVEQTVSQDFAEMDFGHWENRRWDDIGRDALDAWAADFLGYAGHGGESVAQLRDRVARGLDSVPEGALVVTHAGVIKAALVLRGDAAGWDHRPGFGAVVRV
ncbi:alpha-ribazole phosphatase [Puniceibacterium sediminis]|uniref:Alpha-ribazole phosphatase n=1 Tax=Puniceibacterium sediminis TaxID=1608407 RepID=A0A238XIE6_9RHOB|nr:alpha-ribazole phosphatase [Puniceibacterium sediminis]